MKEKRLVRPAQATTGKRRAQQLPASVTLSFDPEHPYPFGDTFGLTACLETFSKLADCYEEAAFVTDPAGRVQYMNAAGEALAGKSVLAGETRHIADLLYTPLNTELRDHRVLLISALEQGQAAVRKGVPVTSARGDVRLVDYQALPLIDSNDELIGGLLVVHNFYDMHDELAGFE